MNRKKRHLKQKWKRWLINDLLPEIRYLLKLKTVFRKLSEVFSDINKYPKNNYFYWYIGRVHSATVVTGLCRMMDERKDVVSLVRLLNEIKENPELISRRAYTCIKQKYREPRHYNFVKRRLDNEFSKMAGKGSFLDPRIIESDLKRIKKITAKTIQYRHKFIGHHAYNQRIYKKTPKLLDIHTCFDNFEKIFRRYFLLITGGDIEVYGDLEVRDIEKDINQIFKSIGNKCD